MRFSPSTLLVIQGIMWLGIGVFLLCKGVLLITLLLVFPQLSTSAFAAGAAAFHGSGNAVVFLIGFGLICGWLKARFVLINVIRKSVYRLIQMSAPIPLKKIFEGRYYLIFACMIALGMSFRFLGLKNDIHGFIAIVIGSALLNGSFLIFRFALEVGRTLRSKSQP